MRWEKGPSLVVCGGDRKEEKQERTEKMQDENLPSLPVLQKKGQTPKPL